MQLHDTLFFTLFFSSLMLNPLQNTDNTEGKTVLLVC